MTVQCDFFGMLIVGRYFNSRHFSPQEIASIKYSDLVVFKITFSKRKNDDIFKVLAEVTSLDNSLRQIDKLEKEGLNFSSRVRSYYYHYCYSNSDIGTALSSATTCVHQSQRKSYF
ncbi:hypothetical protein T05_6054 [Trichinella murrelli]|uniref:Uncharacterized protein n=1 Tax=Trichinella murrelli TaxID=144512 RepID=A0A0V0UFR6_9BILA|nr:hypothetical protein T05_6054 [Trichinella murrelli]